MALIDHTATALVQRLIRWLEQFKSCFGHRAQFLSLRTYVQGVFSDSERKSMQAMLARMTEPVAYQAFQHFITHAPWEADRVCGGCGPCCRARQNLEPQCPTTPVKLRSSPRSSSVPALLLAFCSKARPGPGRASHAEKLNGGYRSVTSRNEYATTRLCQRPTASTNSNRPRG